VQAAWEGSFEGGISQRLDPLSHLFTICPGRRDPYLFQANSLLVVPATPEVGLLVQSPNAEGMP
jgi:hypothetical protein